MGTYNSKTLEDFSTNGHLQKFIGKESISATDVFWNTFLSFPYRQITQEDDRLVFEKTKPLFNQFSNNSLKTGNFSTLIKVFLNRLSNVFQSSNNVIPSLCSQSVNSLLIARYFLQHLVQKFPENEVIKHFEVEASPDTAQNKESEPLLARFISNLFSIIIGFPVFEETYPLHYESINVLLVFLSIELFTTESVSELKIYKIIFESASSGNLCTALLQKFVNKGRIQSHQGSSFFGLGDFMGYFLSSVDNDGPLLAKSSVLLLIALVNQYIGGPNPYRETLSSISDDFPNLYNQICLALEKEETTLLLYHLLHRNDKFRTFVLEQSDIETLVVPMLQAIYHASDSSCHHMYMSLIILLILTEDVEFNKKVHHITLRSVPWYTDRNLGEVTLGGLIILVTTRTVQYNLLKMRDEYLHTNCLAALANMSSQFSNLHPYVCQRLVGLFEVLAKTYNRAKQELVAIEKALRIILEVLNSCLSNQLVRNTNLIYTLLYNKQVFETFRENPAFQDIICNINQVLEYFISKIDSQKETCNDVDSVLKVIVEYSSKWPSQTLQKFPELKFKYVEEEKPEEFFIPYVWSLVSESSCIYLQSSLFTKV